MNLKISIFDRVQTKAAIKRLSAEPDANVDNKLLTEEEAATRKPKSLSQILDEESGLPSVSLSAIRAHKPLVLLTEEQARTRKVRSLAQALDDEQLSGDQPFKANVDDAGEPVLLSASEAAVRKVRTLAQIFNEEAGELSDSSTIPPVGSVKTFNINMRHALRLNP